MITSPRRPRVHGHRGARARFPENSKPAFEYALAIGVDAIEMDILVTKDDRIVVMHDPILASHVVDLTGYPEDRDQRIVRNLTLEELQKFDAGTHIHPRFPGQKIGAPLKIITLDEVFELVSTSKESAAKSVRFNIEIKAVPGAPELTPPAADFARLLVGVVRKYGMEQRTIVQSFDSATLRATRALSSKVELSFLNAESRPDYVSLLQGLDIDTLSPHYLWITKDDVDALHRAGFKVVPWTVNTTHQWDAMIALGVDGMISDNPDSLIRYLDHRGLR